MASKDHSALIALLERTISITKVVGNNTTGELELTVAESDKDKAKRNTMHLVGFYSIVIGIMIAKICPEMAEDTLSTLVR